jgi:hypothetical protein
MRHYTTITRMITITTKSNNFPELVRFNDGGILLQNLKKNPRRHIQ